MSFQVEDCGKGNLDWRNIQPIVRSTFVLLFEQVQTQSMKIQVLEKQLMQQQSLVMDDENESMTVWERMLKLNNSMVKLQNQMKAQNEIVQEKYKDIDKKQCAQDGSLTEIKQRIQRLPQLQQQEYGQVFVTKEEWTRKANVDDVNDGLQLKANKDMMDTCLKNKASRDDLNELELKIMKAQKTTITSGIQNTLLYYISKQCHGSVPERDEPLDDGIDISALLSSLTMQQQHVTGKGQNNILEAVGDKCKELKDEVGAMVKRQSMKLSDTFNSGLAEVTAMVRQRAMANDVQVLLSTKLERQEAVDMLQLKLAVEDAERMMQQQNDAVIMQVQQLVGSLKQELVNVINKKAYKSDVIRSLQTKVSQDDLTKMMAEKADRTDLREACIQAVQTCSRTMSDFHQEVEGDIEALKVELVKKASGQDTFNELTAVRQELANLQGWPEEANQMRKEILLKVGIKDACTLFDTKCNIVDVNQSIDEIRDILDTKSDNTVVKNVNTSLEVIKQQIRGDICMGRWVWKAGRPASSMRTIMWNVEAVNTSSDAFIWDRNTGIVTTVIPGLYQLSAAFFTESAPTVSVIVNGEPVLVISDAIKSKRVHRTRHSGGNLSGTTVYEYLALPPRSEVSITYSMDEKAQGFMALRKL